MSISLEGVTVWMKKWQDVLYWPLTVAALLFLVAYTVQVVQEPTGVASIVTNTIILVTWVMFILDYVIRWVASDSRKVWFRTHLFDLAVVLVPVLRPVRLLDAMTRITSFMHSAGTYLRAKLLIYGSGAMLLLVWSASLAVLYVERYATGATIRSFGDSLWWAFCTVTTVGYGDLVPVTVIGRVIAVLLMFGGVILVGIIVATLTSYVSERTTAHSTKSPPERLQ